MKKLITILATATLLVTLTGCEQVMQAPDNRDSAHKRCVEANGVWEETAKAWRCNS